MFLWYAKRHKLLMYNVLVLQINSICINKKSLKKLFVFLSQLDKNGCSRNSIGIGLLGCSEPGFNILEFVNTKVLF